MWSGVAKKIRLQDYFTDYGWSFENGQYVDSWGTRSLSKSQVRDILRKMSKDATAFEISQIIINMVGHVRAPIMQNVAD